MSVCKYHWSYCYWALYSNLTIVVIRKYLKGDRCVGGSVGRLVGQSVSQSVSLVKNQSFRNKNCTWRPCLSTDRDKMSNLYRRPPIVASYKVSVFIVSSFSDIMCTDFVCLYTYEFWLSLWKIVRSSAILLLPIFIWLSSLRGKDLIKSAN